MTRTLIAALGMIAVASSAMADEVKLFVRTIQPDGSEVVLDLSLPDYNTRFRLNSKQDRLKSIRDCMDKFRRPHEPFLIPAPDGGMDYEVPLDLAVTLRRYQRLLANDALVDVVTVSDLNPRWHDTDHDQLVTHVLHACEGWKRDADRLLLDSLSGVDDPGFFSVIEWYMNRPGR
jgi:hypothetical protein